jgi:hypothetical protein
MLCQTGSLRAALSTPSSGQQMEQRSPVIFIDYRHSDRGWPADRLAEKLRTAFGNDRVFLDVGIKGFLIPSLQPL